MAINSKIYWEEVIPHRITRRKNIKYEWEKSEGIDIKFKYNDIIGIITILNFINSKNIFIKYLDYEPFKITIGDLKLCKLGKLLRKNTSDFKIEIGQVFKDDNRDITVIDRKRIESPYRQGTYFKYYKYKCNRCGFECGEHWSCIDKEYKEELRIEESNLLKGQGCSCCCLAPRSIVKAINSIYKTDPWMIPYIGEEVAKTHTRCSNNKIEVTCPDCGRVKSKEMQISWIYKTHSIGCSCSDNISYPEKLMFFVLEQLELKFQTQLTKTTFEWCKNYRYDFYLEYNDEQYIIETHGEQHYYEKGKNSKFQKTLKEEQLNDKLKRELAIKNRIKSENYIVIDCRYSELEYIKQNMLKSKLVESFDLNKVDWNKSGEFVCSNLVKKICKLKKDNPRITTTEISDITGHNPNIICNWLKKGNQYNWCKYDTEYESYKASVKAGRTGGKLTGIFKNDNILGVFKSLQEIDNISEKLFKIKFDRSCMSSVCCGKRQNHKGYQFKYIEDLTQEEYIKYDIENKLKELHNRGLGQVYEDNINNKLTEKDVIQIKKLIHNGYSNVEITKKYNVSYSVIFKYKNK